MVVQALKVADFEVAIHITSGLWAYYEFGTVRIEGHPENTAEYIWGDRILRNLRCKTCGCATHWEPLVPEPGSKHGVNQRWLHLFGQLNPVA